MTRNEALKALGQKWRDVPRHKAADVVMDALEAGKEIERDLCAIELEAALALPEDSKVVVESPTVSTRLAPMAFS